MSLRSLRIQPSPEVLLVDVEAVYEMRKGAFTRWHGPRGVRSTRCRRGWRGEYNGGRIEVVVVWERDGMWGDGRRVRS